LIAIDDSVAVARLEECIPAFCAAAKPFHTSKEALTRYSNYFEKLVNANAKLKKLVLTPKFKSLVMDLFQDIELPTK
jgi:hypothetical protein